VIVNFEKKTMEDKLVRT